MLRRRPARSPLFPYTTLFRSQKRGSLRIYAHVFTGASDRPLGITRPCRSAYTERRRGPSPVCGSAWSRNAKRSEEHTSELQSQFHLVCRVLLEKENDATGPRE